MKKISRVLCSIFALGLVVSATCAALAVPQAPPLDKPIVDNANILSDEQELELARLINNERLKTKNQIAVLTVPSLEGEVLETYSIKVARQWGVGEKDKDNGVLLLVAVDDRKLRIEVGSGLEGSLTDARASRIIRNVISPKFKQGDYYSGVQKGVSEIQNAIRGEAESVSVRSGAVEENLGSMIEVGAFVLFFLLSLLSWIVSILARTKSWWAGGVFGAVVALVLLLVFGFAVLAMIAGLALVAVGLLFDYFVSKNFSERKSNGQKPAWWAGGTTLGGGGSSSGGSFGGGGFSGGGASGGW